MEEVKLEDVPKMDQEMPTFHCQKHGNIDRYILGILGQDNEHHMYCIFCFNDMIASNCCEATVVKKEGSESL